MSTESPAVADMREQLARRKAAILGELSELTQRRTTVMEAHAATTERHIKAMDKINNRMKELRDQAEHVAAQWDSLTSSTDD
jgi:flagellar biosynthesis/type III secretory pathway chaperone